MTTLRQDELSANCLFFVFKSHAGCTANWWPSASDSVKFWRHRTTVLLPKFGNVVQRPFHFNATTNRQMQRNVIQSRTVRSYDQKAAIGKVTARGLVYHPYDKRASADCEFTTSEREEEQCQCDCKCVMCA